MKETGRERKRGDGEKYESEKNKDSRICFSNIRIVCMYVCVCLQMKYTWDLGGWAFLSLNKILIIVVLFCPM